MAPAAACIVFIQDLRVRFLSNETHEKPEPTYAATPLLNIFNLSFSCSLLPSTSQKNSSVSLKTRAGSIQVHIADYVLANNLALFLQVLGSFESIQDEGNVDVNIDSHVMVRCDVIKVAYRFGARSIFSSIADVEFHQYRT